MELGFLKILGLDLGLGFFLKPKYFWILGYGFELGFFRFLGLDLAGELVVGGSTEFCGSSGVDLQKTSKED